MFSTIISISSVAIRGEEKQHLINVISSDLMGAFIAWTSTGLYSCGFNYNSVYSHACKHNVCGGLGNQLLCCVEAECLAGPSQCTLTNDPQVQLHTLPQANCYTSTFHVLPNALMNYVLGLFGYIETTVPQSHYKNCR